MPTASCVILSVLAATACAGSASAASFTKATTVGVPVRIGSHATWDLGCRGTPARVEVVEPPQHGQLSSREERITITRVDHGTTRCLGHQTLARVLFYAPAPGFAGTDRFYYTSLSRTGAPVPHSGSVVVRP